MDTPKRLKDTNGRDMSTRTSVCLYNQPVTWIFTKSRLSSLSDSDYKNNPFIEKYYLIIVVFSYPHFSIYDIFYTLENTQSFNERATPFKQHFFRQSFPSLVIAFLEGNISTYNVRLSCHYAISHFQLFLKNCSTDWLQFVCGLFLCLPLPSLFVKIRVLPSFFNGLISSNLHDHVCHSHKISKFLDFSLTYLNLP